MDIAGIKRILRQRLGKKRFGHCVRVSRFASELAEKHGIDSKKAEIAGLLHDCAKHLDDQALKEAVSMLRIRLSPSTKRSSHLHHCFVGAGLARSEFGIKDRDILMAIKNHTLGRPAMSPLEKIIYVADHIEPGRKRKGDKKLRALSLLDLNKTIALVSSEVIQYLRKKKLKINEQTIRTRKYYSK